MAAAAVLGLEMYERLTSSKGNGQAKAQALVGNPPRLPGRAAIAPPGVPSLMGSAAADQQAGDELHRLAA